MLTWYSLLSLSSPARTAASLPILPATNSCAVNTSTYARKVAIATVITIFISCYTAKNPQVEFILIQFWNRSEFYSIQAVYRNLLSLQTCSWFVGQLVWNRSGTSDLKQVRRWFEVIFRSDSGSGGSTDWLQTWGFFAVYTTKYSQFVTGLYDLTSCYIMKYNV